MRHRLAIAAVIPAALLLASCAGGGAANSPSDDASSRFVYLSDLEPTCFDTAAYKNLANYNVIRQIVDPLIFQDTEGNFSPGLATEWESNEDGTVWTFTLRDDVTFHDGEALTADAVQASFARFVAEGSTLSAPRWYASSRAIDESTWELTLAQPTANILQQLSNPDYPILSLASLEEFDDGDRCADPLALVGTGPFIPVEYDQGAKLILERNEDYDWGPEFADHTGPAYLSEVEIQFVPEAQVRIGALTSGAADAIASLPPLNADAVEEAGFVLASAPATGVPFVAPLNTTDGPTADVRIREALRAAVDWDAVVETIYQGRYDRAWTPLAPTTAPAGSYNADIEGSFAFDPDAAAALLAEAGYTATDDEGFVTKDGERLTLRWISDASDIRDQRDVVAEAVQAQAREAGIDISLEQLDTSAYLERVAASDYEIVAESWGQSDAAVFGSATNPKGIAPNGINYSRYADDDLAAWVPEAAGSADPERRAELYRSIQERVNEQVSIIPIYIQSFLVAAKDSVSGIAFDPVGYPTTFYDVKVGG
jgi:peptide/nickel transport system substrate-binding protein